jgi:60 kDa SS-A/Ro ribonucleoprotein
MENNVKADAFVVYTDSETWYGDIHPVQALAEYRKKMGVPDAKLIVVSMVASDFSIADPDDPNMMDVIGFNTSTPQLISEFIRGEI